MAPKHDKTSRKTVKSNINVSAKATIVKKDLLDKINDFFEKKDRLFMYLGLGLTLIFSLLLFDIKVSVGGDDSGYIAKAYDIVHEFKFPTFQAPLYPFALSLIVWATGINLILLKLFSLLCIFASMYLFYKTFSGKMPKVLVTIPFLLLGINYDLLYYSSQTYSEAFYLLLQSVFFWYVVKKFDWENAGKIPLYNYLVLGLIVFLLTISRNIAIASIAAILGYFVLNKKWKSSILTLAGFIVFYIIFEFIKRILWGASGAQVSSQASTILLKDYYNPSLGTEDFWGLINRFFANINLFFSRYVFSFLGLRPETSPPKIMLTVIVCGFLVTAFYWGLKKNKQLLLISIYTIAMCSASFIALQKEWSQSRMIIIYLPFFLVIFFAVIYYATKTSKLKSFQFVIPLMAFIIFLSSLSVAVKRVDKQKEILKRNLKGDMLYGFTPDWKNYILMSKWAAENTPKEYMTAVRKGEISFIYGGRKFYGIVKVPAVTPDSLVKTFNDSLVYVGINMEKLMNKELYNNSLLRSKITAFVNGALKFETENNSTGNEIVGIFEFHTSEFRSWEPLFKQNGLFYNARMKAWLEDLSNRNASFAIYQPDVLVQALQKNKVKYILLASLRVNQSLNTGNVINTLHRYAYFVQLKYPYTFRSIHVIGTDEKAELFEINLQ